MGSTLARETVAAGFAVTAWNRDRAKALAIPGVEVADTTGDAVRAAPTVVVCLLDHASVHDVLDPVAHLLRNRRIVNLTTTSPDGARELSEWADGFGADYLDGGIMAVPSMIGTPAAEVLYSGSRDVFDSERRLLASWGRASHFGDDAGMAALYDLALLAGMYVMFAGFFHGAAMVGAARVPAADFAARATPWLQAMAESLGDYGRVIDAGDYGGPGQQSLLFSDLGDIIAASRAHGVSSELLDVVQRFIDRQTAAGHGADGFARVIESMRAEVAA